MEIRTQVTNKQLSFINDLDLRDSLLERLEELDRVFLVNVNYSTVFGAMGVIEGIFRYIASIFRSEIRASSTYPITSKGNKKRLRNLTINELYIELVNLGILPDIQEYRHFYFLFKNYRNFIHPQAQVRKGWEIGIGQAQMALGLLNVTIQNLDDNIFIGKQIFEKIDGNPNYDSNRVLHLELGNTPHHSLLIHKQALNQKLSLSFDLDLPKGSLLNFVFNYSNEGDFKMVRFDNRRQYRNLVLRSTQKYIWIETHIVDPKDPPDKGKYPVQIEISIPNKVFSVTVDNILYSFKDLAKNKVDLFNEVHENMRVGFFNEVHTVNLSNIEIDVC